MRSGVNNKFLPFAICEIKGRNICVAKKWRFYRRTQVMLWLGWWKHLKVTIEPKKQLVCVDVEQILTFLRNRQLTSCSRGQPKKISFFSHYSLPLSDPCKTWQCHRCEWHFFVSFMRPRLIEFSCSRLKVKFFYVYPLDLSER